ncbi:dihydroneopterin aldolase [Agaribacter marinus]|uniref:7,8-dihydroneopterin aldolase n=1 Tax=Agaribacter marinus TaxID=1431249 RepID=A0AA37WKR6_9ALTE|nr:dihydroneopterin aldolase [Agaribacter marinus]GLR71180.1 7,8-dihydroneopterin aldolase [Agaribacter marinus]
MKDTVFIRGLELSSIIGVYDFERNAKQRVIVDIEIATDLTLASSTDNISDTIDYGHIAETLSQVASNSSFQLLEALGKKMLDTLFEYYPLESVTLTINKPDIIANANGVGVILRRNRTLQSNSEQGNQHVTPDAENLSPPDTADKTDSEEGSN